jgi:hypothetical protein
MSAKSQNKLQPRKANKSMKITITHISNLLKLFECGLINGAGQDVNHFCVQQAVHRVLDGELENPLKDDQPPTWCVNGHIISFGIYLNDQGNYWHSNQARAKGLQRFAIAELGSSKIKPSDFYKKLAIKLAARMSQDREWPMDWQNFPMSNDIIKDFMIWDIEGINKNDQLTWLANAAADVLMELGTEGSQFLYLLDEPDRKKRQERAEALGHEIYANQLADLGSPCSCTWGLSASEHH